MRVSAEALIIRRSRTGFKRSSCQDSLHERRRPSAHALGWKLGAHVVGSAHKRITEGVTSGFPRRYLPYILRDMRPFPFPMTDEAHDYLVSALRCLYGDQKGDFSSLAELCWRSGSSFCIP